MSKNTNVSQFYQGQFDAESKAHSDGDYDTSDRISRELLENPDLPLLLRAGAHAILTTSGEMRCTMRRRRLKYVKSW
jgi:hypothetical protein